MSLAYLWIFIKTRIRQMLSTNKAILKREISYYPQYVKDFERRCAEYFDVPHVLSFCNGTSATEAAMFALGIKPGDEVLVPSCTFHASIDPILNLGATPIFVDVDKHSLTICPEDMAKKITPNTTAVVIVHIFGIPADMQAIQKFVTTHNLKLIEDTSHAHGGEYNGQKLGTFSDIGIFSMQGNKAVAGGEGGIAVTHDEHLFLRMSLFGHFDRHAGEFHKISSEPFRNTGAGHKYRMAPISSLIASADLRYLDRVNAIMQKAESMLDDTIESIEGIRAAKYHADGQRGGYCNGYPIIVDIPNVSGQMACDALNQAGIDCIMYPFPNHHKLHVYGDLEFRLGVLRGANEHLSEQESDIVLPETEYLKTQLFLITRKHLVSMNQRKLNIIKTTLSNLSHR